MDETYVKVRGEWTYLCRAVDKFGQTLDFMLSRRRNKTAATKFFARALEANGLPRKIVIDRGGANTAGINAIDLKRFGCPVPIEMVRIKYLNNIVEQDHRTIKYPCLCQAILGSHARRSLTRALASSRSFRIVAVMVTLAGFPAALSLPAKAMRSGLQRMAASAGM